LEGESAVEERLERDARFVGVAIEQCAELDKAPACLLLEATGLEVHCAGRGRERGQTRLDVAQRLLSLGDEGDDGVRLVFGEQRFGERISCNVSKTMAR
jgi:hypothetical protein